MNMKMYFMELVKKRIDICGKFLFVVGVVTLVDGNCLMHRH